MLKIFIRISQLFCAYAVLTAASQAVAAEISSRPISRHIESFELNKRPLNWTKPSYADANWSPVECDCTDGRYGLISQKVPNRGRAAISISGYFKAGTLNFDYQYLQPPSSLRDGEFYFSVSDQISDFTKNRLDGGWVRYQVDISEGFHTLTWQYNENRRSEEYHNQVIIDNIRFLSGDQDNDGLPDQWEYLNGFDYINSGDGAADFDNDGLSNQLEYQLQSNLYEADTDNDGLADGDEVNRHQTDVLLRDSDEDKFPDGWEVTWGFDPLVKNIQDNDSDGDGFTDYQEYLMQTSPLDASDLPALIVQMDESFESQQLPIGWRKPLSDYLGVQGQNLGWQITSGDASDGNNKLSSETTITNGAGSQGYAFIQWTGYFEAGQLSFNLKQVPSDMGNGLFYVDGGLRSEVDANEQWQTFKLPLTKGVHTLRWNFFAASSNASHNSNINSLWLDNLKFTAANLDSDNDGLPDLWEIAQGLDIHNGADAILDNDGDGLNNLAEYQAGSEINKADTDGDGINDNEEVSLGLNPANADSDDDGLPDHWERLNGTDPLVVSDTLDHDEDGFSNLDEYLNGSAANDSASMPATITEAVESFENGPLSVAWQVPDSAVVEINYNGEHSHTVDAGWQVVRGVARDGVYSLKSMPNGTDDTLRLQAIDWSFYFAGGEVSFDVAVSRGESEFILQLDGKNVYITTTGDGLWQRVNLPLDAGKHTLRFINLDQGFGNGSHIWVDKITFKHDADNDGMIDYWETQHGLDSTNAADALLDLDNDGVNNLAEFQAQSDPQLTDTDGDGLSDSDELLNHLTSPIKVDTDDDGFPDNWELLYGFNPLISNDQVTDTDGDGVSDWGELALSTSPLDDADFPALMTHHIESFESGELPEGWTTGSSENQPWKMIQRLATDGDYSMACESFPEGSKTCEVQWIGYFDAGDLWLDVNYPWIMSSLRFSIDGVVQPEVFDGMSFAQTMRYTLEQGAHTLNWQYTTSEGRMDEPGMSAYIDNLRFFAHDIDSDGDGLTNRWEFDHQLDANNSEDAAADIDNDGLTALQEQQLGTDLRSSDSDNDGISDGDEVNLHQTNPTSSDSDGDGLSDGWELAHQFLPNDPTDASKDSDNDGFSDYHEWLSGSDSQSVDSLVPTYRRYIQSFEDSTLLPSGWTVAAGQDSHWQIEPVAQHGQQGLHSGLVADGEQVIVQFAGDFVAGQLQFYWANSGSEKIRIDGVLVPVDIFEYDSPWEGATVSLSDGFHVIQWVAESTGNPSAGLRLDHVRFFADGHDGDEDGITDLWEYNHGMDINDPADALFDLDNDGATQLQEFLAATDPNNPDSDNDNLPDGWEIQYGLNPLMKAAINNDSDNDGFSDLVEHLAGSSPVDELSTPALDSEYIESFEQATLPDIWVTDGWQIVSDHTAVGEQSLTSNAIDDNQTTAIEMRKFFAAGDLSFALSIDSEQHYDHVAFYLDGQLQTRHSGNLDWQVIHLELSQGPHTLRWVYSKDSGLAEGSDKVWIDNVNFFMTGLDSDADGLPDFWEYNHGLDRFSATDIDADLDGDGLTNRQEFAQGTLPNAVDSDRDGIDDKTELEQMGTDPMNADSDGDGVNDGVDAFPLDQSEVRDIDFDGIGDHQDSDDDGDGLSDVFEIAQGLDPFNANHDADGDGFSNKEELRAGTDPLDLHSHPQDALTWLPLLLNDGQ